MYQENDLNANQDTQNSNEEETNMLNEINDGLNSLRDLSRKLTVTRDPARLSLVSSLEMMISSIQDTQSQLTTITYYRTRMREFYSNGLSKEGTNSLYTHY